MCAAIQWIEMILRRNNEMTVSTSESVIHRISSLDRSEHICIAIYSIRRQCVGRVPHACALKLNRRWCDGQQPNITHTWYAMPSHNSTLFYCINDFVWWKEVLGSCCALFPLMHEPSGECLEMGNLFFFFASFWFGKQFRPENSVGVFFLLVVGKREQWTHIDDADDD